MSTTKQDTAVQRYEIEKKCKEWGLTITSFIDEKISGTKEVRDRKFAEVFKVAKRGDTIVCTEVSRLGRTMTIILDIMKMCLDRGITIRTLKESYVLDDKPATKLILSVFGFASETERNLISERTKEGLAAKKRAGFKLGRPVGSKSKELKLDKYRDYIIISLANGVNKMKIMRKCKCAYCTIYDYIQRRDIMDDVQEYIDAGRPMRWKKYNID